MSRAQFIIVMSIAAVLLYALLANWLIRLWMADTCDDTGRVRLNQQTYSCEAQDR
jgi:hypothetical protein